MLGDVSEGRKHARNHTRGSAELGRGFDQPNTIVTLSGQSYASSLSSTTDLMANQSREERQIDPTSPTMAAAVPHGNSDQTGFNDLFEILRENSGLSNLSSNGSWRVEVKDNVQPRHG